MIVSGNSHKRRKKQAVIQWAKKKGNVKSRIITHESNYRPFVRALSDGWLTYAEVAFAWKFTDKLPTSVCGNQQELFEEHSSVRNDPFLAENYVFRCSGEA